MPGAFKIGGSVRRLVSLLVKQWSYLCSPCFKLLKGMFKVLFLFLIGFYLDPASLASMKIGIDLSEICNPKAQTLIVFMVMNQSW